MACHSVTGAASLGGGGLGPDLTHVVQRLGTPGVTAALQTIAFPTMMGPFTNRALTPVEVTNLVAYLQQADGLPPVVQVAPGTFSSSAQLLLGIGLIATVVLFGVMLLFWPRQRQSISGLLRSRARTGSRRL
jgi:hypothetical protein